MDILRHAYEVYSAEVLAAEEARLQLDKVVNRNKTRSRLTRMILGAVEALANTDLSGIGRPNREYSDRMNSLRAAERRVSEAFFFNPRIYLLENPLKGIDVSFHTHHSTAISGLFRLQIPVAFDDKVHIVRGDFPGLTFRPEGSQFGVETHTEDWPEVVVPENTIFAIPCFDPKRKSVGIVTLPLTGQSRITILSEDIQRSLQSQS
ncbi:MAG TPA: hypothetical protein VJG66_03110 [Patescibacteria group bacterium]|nr:hypothetical protein [Patescibacteria group bacterium]